MMKRCKILVLIVGVFIGAALYSSLEARAASPASTVDLPKAEQKSADDDAVENRAEESSEILEQRKGRQTRNKIERRISKLGAPQSQPLSDRYKSLYPDTKRKAPGPEHGGDPHGDDPHDEQHHDGQSGYSGYDPYDGRTSNNTADPYRPY